MKLRGFRVAALAIFGIVFASACGVDASRPTLERVIEILPDGECAAPSDQDDLFDYIVCEDVTVVFVQSGASREEAAASWDELRFAEGTGTCTFDAGGGENRLLLGDGWVANSPTSFDALADALSGSVVTVDELCEKQLNPFR